MTGLLGRNIASDDFQPLMNNNYYDSERLPKQPRYHRFWVLWAGKVGKGFAEQLNRGSQSRKNSLTKINKIAKNEVMMHYGLAHPKIIKLIDVHIDTEREITYMILEYADGGTLFDKIKMETISKI